jgi:glycosyltransferase involved in cell wall biosynthesis
MARVDCHVHSIFSDHPSEWFLQRLGTKESYSPPELIYEQAIKSGMTFVTLTDHNTMDGVMQLMGKYPSKVFTGVESTAYFPEDGCKVHILVYGLNKSQFTEIERLRTNIYELRDYLRNQNLAHSVAHATFSVNGKLSVEHLEKLILLFDVFEGINGSRDRKSNQTWASVLENLDSAKIESLQSKYDIEPFSDNSWIKSYTGGSDDHAGFFIGKTYTISDAETPDEFVESLKENRTFASGRNNDYQCLAFSVYKIAYDFSKTRTKKGSSLFGILTEAMIGNNFDTLKSKLMLHKLSFRKKGQNRIPDLLFELTNSLKKNQQMPVETRLQLVYDKLSDISDSFFLMMIEAIKGDITKGDVIGIVRNVSLSLPGVFLSVPFFSSLKHMHQNRRLLDQLNHEFNLQSSISKKVLWFTDIINDLNGVSETIQNIGWRAIERDVQMKIVICNNQTDTDAVLPPNVLRLPVITSYTPSFYNTYTMQVPSILKSLEIICDESPDEIVISTPGAVGLLGLLAARLLNIKTTGVFHTDFTRQADHVIGDEFVSTMIESYTKWFYHTLDNIKVPTMEYMNILNDRGFDLKKMSLFKRGIDSSVFFPSLNRSALEKYSITSGLTLLYTGRISKDKNIDFLINVYKRILESRPDVNLLIVGDGPYRAEMQESLKNYDRVVFTGRLDRNTLPPIYSSADLLVYPSNTDTFGMTVLEAQSCGLPALVTDIGGPREIVINNRSGFVISSNKVSDWVDKINEIFEMIEKYPERYLDMRNDTHQRITTAYNWDSALNDIMGEENSSAVTENKVHQNQESVYI